jgi:hypothetical protein
MTSDRVPALLLATSPWSTRHSETVSSTNGHATTNGH